METSQTNPGPISHSSPFTLTAARKQDGCFQMKSTLKMYPLNPILAWPHSGEGLCRWTWTINIYYIFIYNEMERSTEVFERGCLLLVQGVFLSYHDERMVRFKGPGTSCWPVNHAWPACKSEGPTRPTRTTQQQSHRACSILMSEPLH